MDSSNAPVVVDHEVFLSFIGEDTLRLMEVVDEFMSLADISVFRGGDILGLAADSSIDSIFAAIGSCKVCIPIFSPRFAASKWCLREVTKMVEMKKIIFPVFYNVSPDDVKLKTSLYTDDLRRLEEELENHEEVEIWKESLKVAAMSKGMEAGGKRSFTKLSKQIADGAVSLLGPRPRKRLETDYVVGEVTADEAIKLLDMESGGVVCLGIYGMGGIGKTIIATLIYNEILSSFHLGSFVPDIRYFSNYNGIGGLAEYFYKNLDPKTNFNMREQISKEFRNKRVLIVLDGVDSCDQICEIAKDVTWFGWGSRIIVTTRDKRVVQEYSTLQKSMIEVRHLEMKELKSDAALKLFSKCAFGKYSPPSSYQNLSEIVVAHTGGLPLAVIVMAKTLRYREEAVWEEIVYRLERSVLVEEVRSSLLMSYFALQDEQKEIFLDIACFFVGHYYTETSNAFYMWQASDLYPYLSFEILQSLSLLKIDEFNRLQMHDQFRDLGRYIVRTDSGNDLMRQSRLWEGREVLEVLKHKHKEMNMLVKGYFYQNIIKALRLPSYVDSLSAEDFESFDSLRFLEVGRSQLQGDFSHILPQLTWFSSQCISWEMNFIIPTKLAILDLSESGVDQNWDGWSQIQALEKLKVLDLSHCQRLTRTPVFAKKMYLERLVLEKCKNLASIDPSIGKLKRLTYLGLSYCDSLLELPIEIGDLCSLRNLNTSNCLRLSKVPTSISSLSSLETLSFNQCRNLKNLPDSLGQLRRLRELDLEQSGITTLPDSIGQLERLEHLSLKSCESLKKLPQSLGKLQSLARLDLSLSQITHLPSTIGGLWNLEHLDLLKCSKIRRLPDSFGDLRSLGDLDLSYSDIAEFPDSFQGLEHLVQLDLKGCRNMRKLPDSFGKLKKLKRLNLEGSGISQLPESIGGLQELEALMLSGSDITRLPSTINQLPRIQTLNLDACNQLQELPGLPVSLKELHITSDLLSRVPILSNLQNLISLKLICGDILGWHGSFPAKLQTVTIELLSISTLPDLSNCFALTKLTLKCQHSLEVLPNLSGLRKLVTLRIESCKELTEIPGIGKLRSLTSLCIQDCPSLVSLENLRELQALKEFECFHCEKLVEIPGIYELRGLHVLRVDHNYLGRSNEMGELKNLKELSMVGSRQPTEIPTPGEFQYLASQHAEISLLNLENLRELQQLKHLKLDGLPKLTEISGLDSLRGLTKIVIQGCDSLERLDNLTDLEELSELSLIGCKDLIEIPDIGKLRLLEFLCVDDCASLVRLENLGELRELRRVDLIGCRKLVEVPGLQWPTDLRIKYCDSFVKPEW